MKNGTHTSNGIEQNDIMIDATKECEHEIQISEQSNSERKISSKFIDPIDTNDEYSKKYSVFVWIGQAWLMDQ